MRDRSLTEWVVLALVAEGTTHGFEVARTLADGGDLGRIWTVRRPLVYRAIDALLAEGALVEGGTADSARGPRRRLVRATPAARREVRRWLEEPAVHVRDVRTELLVKLALHERAGTPWDRLARAQRALLATTLDALHHAADHAEGFDAVLARWRVESASAAHRFVSSLIVTNETDAPAAAAPAGRPPRRVRGEQQR